MNDYYINFSDSAHVYVCALAGEPDVAKWSYAGAISGAGTPITEYAITVPASGWVASGSVYTNMVTVSGMTSSIQITDMNLASSLADSDDAITGYGYLTSIETGSGQVVFTATAVPAVDLIVTATGV